MAKAAPLSQPVDAAKFVLLGSTGRFHRPLPAAVQVCRVADLDQLVQAASTRVVFISCRRTSTDALLRASPRLKVGPPGRP